MMCQLARAKKQLGWARDNIASYTHHGSRNGLFLKYEIAQKHILAVLDSIENELLGEDIYRRSENV